MIELAQAPALAADNALMAVVEQDYIDALVAAIISGSVQEAERAAMLVGGLAAVGLLALFIYTRRTSKKTSDSAPLATLEKIDRLEDKWDARFDRLDERMSRLEKKFDDAIRGSRR